jgi:thiosulfate dehydrogenase
MYGRIKIGLIFALVSLNVIAAPTSPVRPSMVEPRLTLPGVLIDVPVANPTEYHLPPDIADIPLDKYGDQVRYGRNIFINTTEYAARYVGNKLNCSNCHLGEGRKPHSAPLWAAYTMYPSYRIKNDRVNTLEERIQGCFKYSMDGFMPTVDAPEVRALMAYMHWLSKGVPVGVEMQGRGFAFIKRTSDPSPQRGKETYLLQCEVCHGKNGEGTLGKDKQGYAFPPLWGFDSYNKGAGMYRTDTLAAFIKANMPFGRGFSLTDQQSLDVAAYINMQIRPNDPREGQFSSVMSELFEWLDALFLK